MQVYMLGECVVFELCCDMLSHVRISEDVQTKADHHRDLILASNLQDKLTINSCKSSIAL